MNILKFRKAIDNIASLRRTDKLSTACGKTKRHWSFSILSRFIKAAKYLILLTIFSLTGSLHIHKPGTKLYFMDTELKSNQPIELEGIKKIRRASVEHVILKNCTGIIDQETFKHFPKLKRLSIWKSRINEINTNLSVTAFESIGSYLPDLDANFQGKFPNVKELLFYKTEKFNVHTVIWKNFKHLKVLKISDVDFAENCVTKNLFRGMESLEELGLSNNNIGCVTADAFSSLKSLQSLDLTYNRIKSFPSTIFKGLTNLEDLGLFENPLIHFSINMLADQRHHLRVLGLDWAVLKNEKVTAEKLLKAFPNLKFITFGHLDMPQDFYAGSFCQILKENNVLCENETVFGASILLYQYF
ncbi:hypothetical protein ABEB36_013661 [Hypothenemus hampei]|uniref:Uncharacterized protein n=1 Tax=Hypothenemus hampei TaxID=57062 RepID=A0ABD1E4W3_HYPHA